MSYDFYDLNGICNKMNISYFYNTHLGVNYHQSNRLCLNWLHWKLLRWRLKDFLCYYFLWEDCKKEQKMKTIYLKMDKNESDAANVMKSFYYPSRVVDRELIYLSLVDSIAQTDCPFGVTRHRTNYCLWIYIISNRNVNKILSIFYVDFTER